MKTLLIFFLSLIPLFGFELPKETSQVLVGIAPSWNSSQVTLHLFEKQGRQWIKQTAPWKGRLGRNGLAWGRGVHPYPQQGLTKKEGDKRAPAGVFRMGGVWGYSERVSCPPQQFYRKITARDLWVEDSKSKYYNQHLTLDRNIQTKWEKKQQMRQGDAAHSLKMFIGHNSPPNAVPGAGSAIFFHIWRGGGSKPTAGCTTMAESKLRALIATIDPVKKPLYVLLPKDVYQAVQNKWKLPSITTKP